MPTTDDLLIRNMPKLKQELRIAAAQHGWTLREECIVRLSIAPPDNMLAKPVFYDSSVDHDPSTCRNKFCGVCKAIKERKGTK